MTSFTHRSSPSFVLAGLLLAAGCTGAHRDTPVDPGDGELCGEEVCAPAEGPTCIDGDTLRTHASTCEAETCSYRDEDVECGALGCCDDHCCAVSPSNSLELGALERSGRDIEILDGVFDTSDDCVDDSPLGDCSVATTAVGEACVCRADKIRIGDLRVVGSRALALFAHREVLVTGALDLGARGDLAGPGASYTSSPSESTIVGGVGGSYGTKGGAASNVPSGETVGTQTLIPLAGGARGGDSGGAGGGGGGAIQISAGFRVDIVGAIDVGGGGGLPGTTSARGGGGGGSGGAILLEAPTVIVGGKLLAKGGGGASGSTHASVGLRGWDAVEVGDQITDAARGGAGVSSNPCANVHYSGAGGMGANGTVAATAGGYGTSFGCGSQYTLGGGGGGGGNGRIRINTIDECQCTGPVIPAPTFGTVITR